MKACCIDVQNENHICWSILCLLIHFDLQDVKGACWVQLGPCRCITGHFLDDSYHPEIAGIFTNHAVRRVQLSAIELRDLQVSDI